MDNDDNFEILVSTQDYLQVRETAKELEKALELSRKENLQLREKFLQIQQKYQALQIQKKKLEENQHKLSQIGLSLSNKIFELEDQKEKEEEKHQTQKQELSKRNQTTLEALSIAKEELAKKKQELAQIKNVEKMHMGTQFSVSKNEKSIITTPVSVSNQAMMTAKRSLTEHWTMAVQLKLQEQGTITEEIKHAQNSMKYLEHSRKDQGQIPVKQYLSKYISHYCKSLLLIQGMSKEEKNSIAQECHKALQYFIKMEFKTHYHNVIGRRQFIPHPEEPKSFLYKKS